MMRVLLLGLLLATSGAQAASTPAELVSELQAPGADIAAVFQSAFEAGMTAEAVIAAGLQAGLTLEEIMLAIAEYVGSDSIDDFRAAATRVAAIAVGVPQTDPLVIAAVRAAIGSAQAPPGFTGTAPATFSTAPDAPVMAQESAASILAISGRSSVIDIASSITGTRPAGNGLTGLGGEPRENPGGRLDQFTLCQIVASENGCLQFAQDG
jgi:hypothetical protein